MRLTITLVVLICTVVGAAMAEEIVVVGDHFETESGEVVVLRGVQSDFSFNSYSTSYLKSELGDRYNDFMRFGYLAWMNSWDAGALSRVGMNCIRLRFAWSEFSPEIGEIDPWAIYRYRTFLDQCAAHGVYVIPAMTPPGGWGSGSQLWGNDENKEWFYWLWAELARLSSGHEVVLGYDLQNEPYPPSEMEYIEVCIGARDAIREYSDKPIIYAFPFGGISMPDVSHTDPYADIYDPQGVVTAHFYWPTDYTHMREPGACYPGYCGDIWIDEAELIERMERRWSNYLNRNPVPFYLGEFGCMQGADGSLDWIEDVRDFADQWMAGWTFFKYKARKTSAEWGVVRPLLFDHTHDILGPMIRDQDHEFTFEDFEPLLTPNYQVDEELLDVLRE